MGTALSRLLDACERLIQEDAALRRALVDIAELVLDRLREAEPVERGAAEPGADPRRPGEERRAADKDARPPDKDARPPDPDAPPPDGTDAPAPPQPPLKERLAVVLEQSELERTQASRRAVAERPATEQPTAHSRRDESVEQARDAEPDKASLTRLAADSAVKAEASRWVGERQRRIARNAVWEEEIAPGDREVVQHARAAGVHVWMCRPDAPVPADPSVWDTLAGNYDALADALKFTELVLEVDSSDETLEEAMVHLAAAQSALRVIVEEIDEREDETQRDAFLWLRQVTDARRIYVKRHMRLNDLADPHDWGGLRERIAGLEDAVRQQVDSRRKVHNEWGRLRYHLQRIPGSRPEDALQDWAKALDALERLVDFGVQPSSVKLRDVLVPFVDDLPDDAEPGPKALLALREVDRYLALREAQQEASREAEEEAAEPSRSDEELAVQRLLHGRAMVLIGGEERGKHKEAIARSFGLSELIWLDGASPSFTQFEPAIAREDVAVVVLLIRWSSHGFGEVKSYCDQHDKPLVRIPAGYNPKQLAHHILGQAGERLADARNG